MLGVDNRSRPTSITCQWTSAGYGLSREKSSGHRCRFEEGFLNPRSSTIPLFSCAFLLALFCTGSHIIVESCSTENWDATLPNGVDNYILACALKEPPKRGMQVSGIHYFIHSSFLHPLIHACMHPSSRPSIHPSIHLSTYSLISVSYVHSSNYGMGLGLNVGKTTNTAIQARTYFRTQERTRFRLSSQALRQAEGI